MSSRLSVPPLLAEHAAGAPLAFGADGDVSADLVRGGARAVADALPPATPGSEVIVLCRDRARFAAALFGVWRAGHAAALPPNAQPETVHALRRREGVVTVLHDGDDERGFDVRPLMKAATPTDEGLLPVAPEQHLATVYTSGSTGAHRACPKTAAQLLGEVGLLLETFADQRGARVLAIVPPHHIYGLLFGVLMPAVGGGAFYRYPAPSALMVVDALGRFGVQTLISVPAHLHGLRALEAGELPPVSRVFSSGAPLPRSTAGSLNERAGWRVTEVLGSSETGGIAHRLQDGSTPPPWCALEGVQVAAGEHDAMMLTSPLLAADEAQPWRGADRVRCLEDGSFLHLGRVDGVLKIGSTRVSVAELEERLVAIPGVEEAAVVPVEVGGSRGWETWAVVVAPGLDKAQLRAALRAHLVPVVLPRRYRFVDALPRQASGKLRRDDLLAFFDAPETSS